MTPRPAVLLFTKYPEPGTVKTRMVPPLSAKDAADLHETCVVATCRQLREVHGLPVTLVVTPDQSADTLRERIGRSTDRAWPQGGGDLGARLDRAASRSFAEGADAVLLFGGDSPTIPYELIRQTLARLREEEVVLGPCDDGGYYLLGLRRNIPALFTGIEWGGPRVAEQTRQRCRTAGVEPFELPPWYDLDRPADLHRALADLEARPDVADAAWRDLHDTLKRLARLVPRTDTDG